MKFSAVLFDLDGTLLDTLEDIAASMNAALGRSGFPPHPVQRYRQYVGGGVADLSHRVLPAGSGEEEASRVEEYMREEYSLRWADKTGPYPGIRALLDALREAGVRRAVLSNKPDDFTRMLCDRFFLPEDFEIVRGAVEGMPKKPDPTAALDIARGMGIEPVQFAYLGDSGSDMKTALAAGMYPVGALWGFRGADEISAAGAKIIIERPEEFMKLVDKHVNGYY
jgi:phosphoglycolate phosphatase